jgi:hypothetical protein
MYLSHNTFSNPFFARNKNNKCSKKDQTAYVVDIIYIIPHFVFAPIENTKKKITQLCQVDEIQFSSCEKKSASYKVL